MVLVDFQSFALKCMLKELWFETVFVIVRPIRMQEMKLERMLKRIK